MSPLLFNICMNGVRIGKGSARSYVVGGGGGGGGFMYVEDVLWHTGDGAADFWRRLRLGGGQQEG